MRMIERDSIPDDVPVPDAVEQKTARWRSLPIWKVWILPSGVPIDDGSAPLESNELDWQEQRQVVEDPDPDEFR